MFSSITETVLGLAETMPLETFVLFASFLEEVIAPIPSPSIMVIAGSAGVVQGYTYSGLALLVLFASIGKTLGGIVMYWIAHSLKDFALTYFGKYIDLTQNDIDRFAAHFKGTPKDYALYIFFRSVPIIPSILLSFGSGVIRLPVRLFIIGTFIGTIVRDTFYILVGYKGTELLREYLHTSSHAESIVQLLALVVFCTVLLYLFYRKRKKIST